MTESATEPLLSPLHERAVELGAKFSTFGGWSMPLEYAGGGVLAEHTAVRESVGVFDVSHLGKIRVHGAGAAELVDGCLTADLGKASPGQAQYTLLCAEDGGVIDDMIAYLFGPDDVFLIPNAANCARVAAVLAAAAPDGVLVENRHSDYAVLAVQGRRSDEVLRDAGLPVGQDYMSFVATSAPGLDVPLTLCRTGYTGERGYELVCPSDAAVELWDRIMAAGASYGMRPAGLGARDTLRTEMGYPLCGQDIGSEISPVQARLGWAVGWRKPSFAGRDALLAEKERGPVRLLRGLRALGRGIPRPGMTVRDEAGHDIGAITSGTFSPTLKTGIGLALLEPSTGFGARVVVDVRNRSEQFEVVKPPFVTPGVREP